MSIARDGDEITLRGGSERVFLASTWSVFLLIGISMVIVGTGVADKVSGGLLLVGSGWVFVRLVRVQVRATRDALVIRGWWRSRTLLRSEVVGADVVPANPDALAVAVMAAEINERAAADGDRR